MLESQDSGPIKWEENDGEGSERVEEGSGIASSLTFSRKMERDFVNRSSSLSSMQPSSSRTHSSRGLPPPNHSQMSSHPSVHSSQGVHPTILTPGHAVNRILSRNVNGTSKSMSRSPSKPSSLHSLTLSFLISRPFKAINYSSPLSLPCPTC